jgi:hypothetical protein
MAGPLENLETATDAIEPAAAAAKRQFIPQGGPMFDAEWQHHRTNPRIARARQIAFLHIPFTTNEYLDRRSQRLILSSGLFQEFRHA